MQHMRGQMRLDGQALRQELLVKVLAGLLAHQDAATAIVLRGTASTTHHLKDVHDRIVDVSVLFSFIGLGAHDDDHIARDGETPCGVLRGNEDLYCAGLEKALDDPFVLLGVSLVIISDAVFEHLGQALIRHMIQVRLKIGQLDVEESVGSVISAAMREKIIRRQATLASGRNEDNNRLSRGVLHDGEVSRLRHGDHE